MQKSHLLLETFKYQVSVISTLLLYSKHVLQTRMEILIFVHFVQNTAFPKLQNETYFLRKHEHGLTRSSIYQICINYILSQICCCDDPCICCLKLLPLNAYNHESELLHQFYIAFWIILCWCHIPNCHLKGGFTEN